MSYYSKSKKEEKIVFLFNQLNKEDKEYIINLLDSIIKMNIEINQSEYFIKNQNAYKTKSQD